MKRESTISDRDIERAVAGSAKLEGYSFAKAKKNKAVIKLLQKYGRAFSL
jgi:hypothetical protein